MAIRWYGLVAPEEQATGDRRMFASQALDYRDFPLPAAWQRVSGSGHSGSVVVASWDRQYAGEGGIWGAGEFLNPQVVPEVLEAMYLLQKKLIGPSVDLDPDLAYEVVPHPDNADEFAMKVTKATVHGVTFVMGPAFPQVHITVENDDEASILASAGIDYTFAVNKSAWRSWPVAEREVPWKFNDAIARIAEWSGGDPKKYAQAFLYQDKSADPNNRESYRLPIADVINGRLVLIPRGVMSAANFMSKGHGGLEQIPEAEWTQIQEVLTEIYDSLRETYGDPRFIAPWQRGGRAGATSSEDGANPASTASLDDEGEDMTTFAVRSSGWSSLPTSTGAWDEGAARRALDEWAGDDIDKYGRAFLWSDGSGNKTGFKFPIAMPVDGRLTIFIRAVNNAKARLNQANIPAADKSRIEGILNTIQRRYGGGDEEASLAFEMDDDDECGEGRHRMPDGTCMDDDDPAMDDYGLTAAGVLTPPRAWFDDPKLNKATPLTVTDDGRVFGHLAPWGVCHLAIGNKCQMVPRSATGYKHFHLGTVRTDDGRDLPIGKITLGTGHADRRYGVQPAVEHYDHTGTCVAVVRAGEDAYGVWVAGALVSEVSQEKIAELRRSPLSGDWRRVNGNLELVAALAVNDPGFAVLHDDRDGAYSLTAAGVFLEQDTDSATPVDPIFAVIDEYLDFTDRQERRKMVESIYGQLMLPGEEGCGCGV